MTDNRSPRPMPEWWVSYLLQSEPRLFILSGLSKLLWSACALTCAFYFVRELVENNVENVGYGVGICFAYLVVAIILSAASQFLGLFSGQLGSRVKARLAALVAEHALLHAVTSQSSQALALTLSSSDAHLVYDGAMAIHYLWAAPVEAIVITALLIVTAKDSAWIAAGIVAFIVITMYALSIIMTRIRGRFNAVQSKQVTLFFEVLQNMRPFRFYGWDAFFLGRLNKLTDEMAPLLLRLGLFKSLNLALVFACPPLMGIAIFGHFTKTSDLLPGVAFPSLSLFNTLRFALVVLPNAVRAYSSASTAYNRIREFLNSDKAVDTRVLSPTAGAVEIEHLPVGPNKTILASWKAQPGELWVFQGPVRSYKSTLIETIAGHYPIPSQASVRVGGRVSYAMQQPWMQQATIKDNIVCCEPWNEERYKQVIFACALTTDLSIMPLGDATPVAEKGISLSGGQRQRVALARAVYRIADIYLLDNPISALDDQTQEHVWTHLFEGLLRSATVIVGSSRPVISCTAVLNLSTNGVLEGESGVTKFNGPVVASASAVVPPRYSKNLKTSAMLVAPAESESPLKSSDVAVDVSPPLPLPDAAIQTQSRSPKMEPATPASFRSRVGSLSMTIEEAAVFDVSKEVEAYARYADMIEEEQASVAGGIASTIKDALFGSSVTTQSVAVEMLAVQSDAPNSDKPHASNFRSRTTSFKDFLQQQMFQEPVFNGSSAAQYDTTTSNSSVIKLPASDSPTSSRNGSFRVRTGSMEGMNAEDHDATHPRPSFRERVGSRRASFMDYSQIDHSLFMTGSIAEENSSKNMDDGTNSSVFDMSRADDLPSNSKQADQSVASTASAPEATQKPKHGLRRWVDAGGIRVYLFICIFYPLAQGTRIVSDSYVRIWAEKSLFSSQQSNLEVYSFLVGGFIIGLLLRDISFFRFSVQSATEMRRALCAAIMQAPMMFFMTENLGPLTGVFTRDLSIVSEELADAIHMGTIYLMILLTTMTLISAQATVEPRLGYFAIAAICLLGLSAWIQVKYAKKVKAAKKEFQKTNDEVFLTLSDSLEGVKVLRTANETTWSIDLLTEAFKNARVSTVANENCTLWLARRADAMGVALSFLTCILCITLKVAAGPKGLAISNSLQILVFYSWMMKNVAAAIYSSGSVDRIYEYVSSIPQEKRSGDALDKQWPAKGDIEFRNIILKYAPSLPPALDGVSFKLPHAAKVGVVGRTGSGKSTLLVALFRLIQPCDGTIVLNGRGTLSADLDALRNQLSIVPQEPAMFSGTLRENIDPFFRYSDAAVAKAVHECGLEGRSLDAVVGVSGENFSLGEKQLVCLARVLLKQPALLALDEATSALDQSTEVLFQRVLEEKFQETTILCIAHRLETLRWCRTRIEMGTGKLLSISDFNPESAASHH